MTVSEAPITIHVLSDSLGETGDMVARAAAAQFAEDAFRIERLPKITNVNQLRECVEDHCGTHCLFFYTLVDEDLRREMELLRERGVHGVDLLGPAVQTLSGVTGLEPIGEAGAVHRTDQDYFDRIEAMEFAVSHDDGRNPAGLLEADIVLVGVSRTSKTPLAMYLAFKGYRTANIPLAPGVAPPQELYEVDRRRLFGLVSNADVLMEIRTARMRELGSWVPGYADREAIEQELSDARALMRKLGCLVIHTDDRAVEESAQEIIKHVSGGLVDRD